MPELGTPVCRHRRGLVPETLAPLLEKRRRYKALVRALPEHDPRRQAFQRRYSAHKWLLVTCFGYLGYKNARFGRIEAHEAVTAYGREVLLRAKEIVEERGFRVLHLYVDGLWIDRPGEHSSGPTTKACSSRSSGRPVCTSPWRASTAGWRSCRRGSSRGSPSPTATSAPSKTAR